MGLLDFMNTDEGRQGLALLGAAGPSMEPMNFASRLAMAGRTMQANKQDDLKEQLVKAQLGNYASEIEARKLAGLKDARQQALIESVFPMGSAPISPGAFKPSMDGYGPTMPPQMQGQAQGGGLSNMTPDQIARLKLGGMDITDIYKFAKEPQKLEQGSTYQDRTTGAERFMPKVGEGIAPGANGFYAPLPGYAESQGTIEGAKTRGVEAAKAGFDLVKVVGPDGAERYVPRTTVLGTQPAPAKAAGPEAGMRTAMADPSGPNLDQVQREIAATKADLAKALDAPSRAMLAQHLAGLEKSASTMKPGGAPDFQATPTTAQKLSATAGDKINETWLKTSYEPVKIAGDAATDMLTNVQVARNSMRDMPGGTGWGAEAKATGAAILTSLGIAPGNAKMYAANAQTFQSASMSNLQTVLNAAKGPQTEGDADRAGKTFAQLKNTPQANEFILDLSEAKAQRDQMKAQFYEQALPVARGKGDLQEVDREWRKRAPSVFTMPTMQKWGKK